MFLRLNYATIETRIFFLSYKAPYHCAVTLNGAYLDIKEIYDILKAQENI